MSAAGEERDFGVQPAAADSWQRKERERVPVPKWGRLPERQHFLNSPQRLNHLNAPPGSCCCCSVDRWPHIDSQLLQLTRRQRRCPRSTRCLYSLSVAIQVLAARMEMSASPTLSHCALPPQAAVTHSLRCFSYLRVYKRGCQCGFVDRLRGAGTPPSLSVRSLTTLHSALHCSIIPPLVSPSQLPCSLGLSSYPSFEVFEKRMEELKGQSSVLCTARRTIARPRSHSFSRIPSRCRPG